MPDDSEPTVSADRVEELLEHLLEVPEAEQAAALGGLCAQHPDLAQTLRSRFELFQRLLGAQRGAPDSGREPFGEFELERELGRGGMGVVYLARQRRGATERLVALKLVLDRGMFSPQTRERFRREAEAAFRLDHPVICPVLDVGEVSGTPYLAMRYVAGETLAQRIAAARQDECFLELPTPEQTSSTSTGTRQTSVTASDRVGVIVAFIEQVARALHAAHEAGLVHRDVKPGNLMVTPEGAPVLLDFGLVRDTADETSRLTLTGQPIGTPAYMSPEQISPKGRSLGPTTDVYSLGATLFEALTLRPPFEARTREELFRQILTETPPDPRRLAPGISRDVVVVLKTALDKDPARRYATALELAEDLRRARQKQPILARPPGVARRLRLWGQRNPLASAILVLLMAAQVVIAMLAVQARRSAEEARVAEARAVTHFTMARDAVAELTRIADEHLKDVPWLEPVRRDLFDKALAFYDRFLEDEVDDPALQMDAAVAQRESGTLLRSLGDLDAASERLEAATRSLEPLVDRVDGARRQLAWTRYAGAQVARRQGDTARAKREFLAGIELWRLEQEQDPGSVGVRMALAEGLRYAAEVSIGLDEPRAARLAIDEALGLLDDLPADTPGRDIEQARELGLSARAYRDARDFDAADAQFAAAATALRGHLEKVSYDRTAQALLGTNRIAHGRMYRSMRRYDPAVAALQEARDVFESLSRAFPGIPDYQYNLATCFQNLATLARRRGDEQGGVPELELAIPIFEQLSRDHPADTGYRTALVGCHINLGNRTWRNAPNEAITHFDRALELLDPLLEAHSDGVRYLGMAASASNMWALCLVTTDRDAEAGPMMAQARGYAQKLVALHPENPASRRTLGLQLYNEGRWLAATGDLETAAVRLRESCDQRRWLVDQPRHDPRTPFDLTTSWTRLGWVEDLRGDGAAVWREAQNAIAEWSEADLAALMSTPDGRFHRGCIEYGFAAASARAGDHATARVALGRAFAELDPGSGGPWNDLEMVLALTLDAVLARDAGAAERVRASTARAAGFAAGLDHERFESELELDRLRRGLRELEELLPDEEAQARAAVQKVRVTLGDG